MALKLSGDNKFWVRVINDTLVILKDLAYADDSLTPCADLITLQRKADIVSAFAIIFGFEISITKLRSLLMEWGNEVPKHLFPSSSSANGNGLSVKWVLAGRSQRKERTVKT